jgi:hypothetical protein
MRARGSAKDALDGVAVEELHTRVQSGVIADDVRSLTVQGQLW